MLHVEPVKVGDSTELKLQGKSEFKLHKAQIGTDFKPFQIINVKVSPEAIQDSNTAGLGMRQRLVEEFDAFLTEIEVQ